jgi:hypothetical protein
MNSYLNASCDCILLAHSIENDINDAHEDFIDAIEAEEQSKKIEVLSLPG